MAERKRRVYSVKDELLKKSQEAALAAIQIFNNPLITFKSESFIVLMVISWTYLLHAYYRDQGIDYRYYTKKTQRKKYDTTTKGAYKYWELERCLNEKACPLDKATKDNLKFLIGIRHEIEHQMTNKIDDYISGKFQACCINYNESIKKHFGKSHAIDKTVPIALQLFSFGENQITQLKDIDGVPKNLIDFVSDYENGLDSKNDPKYSYRVIYIRDNVNHEGQADVAYRFVDEKSADGKEIHNILVKNVTRKKLSETVIVDHVNAAGFLKFNRASHQRFWKERWKTAKIRNTAAAKGGFGELIMDNIWTWYEDTWLPEVMEYCEKNRAKFA